MQQFTTVDTVIVICYMIVLICVGIWVAKKTKAIEPIQTRKTPDFRSFSHFIKELTDIG